MLRELWKVAEQGMGHPGQGGWAQRWRLEERQDQEPRAVLQDRRAWEGGGPCALCWGQWGAMEGSGERQRPAPC